MQMIDTIRWLKMAAVGLTALAFLLALGTWAGVSNFGASDASVSDLTGSSAVLFLLAFLLASSVLTAFAPVHIPRLIFLCGIFPLLVGWRIAALFSLQWIVVVCAIVFLIFAGILVCIAVHDLRADTQPGRAKTTLPMIQLAFVRLYIGLDLVPHFTEKLFAGPQTRGEDVAAFQALGVSDPLQFVLLAGVIECAAALGVGLGVLTRLACFLTVIYLMVATIMGHHFSLGFIWASPGGGWEYPMLWSVLILSFVVGGGRWMSLDEVISEHFRLPRWIKALMGDVAAHGATRVERA
ncbi:MAG: DoxX family protein [Pseudomonadota bacterium]